jgi:microcystin-dependent protein
MPQKGDCRMSQPFVGEIRLFAGNFAPAGWEFCNGQSLSIAQNETLFQLIGTTYGGDGISTYALPNLQSRVPVHTGGAQGYVLGQTGGAEQVALTTQQMPQHTHAAVASANPGDTNVPGNTTILASMGPSGIAQVPAYLPPNVANTQVALNNATVAAAGGNQPHSNIQPYLTVSYIISLYGIFPSPN